MLAADGSVRLEERESLRVDEIRIIATVLLVTYHVIGLPETGLHIPDPHPLRLFADIVADFRMPAFAFIAGLVYALRPPGIGSFGPFLRGKLRRLAIPGLIAALIFDVISGTLGLERSLPLASLWQILVCPYAHYWFLQAILLLFLIIGLFDATTKHRTELPMFGIATLLSLSSLPFPPIFSINNAIHLAPFFLAGICYARHQIWMRQRRGTITAIALALIILWAVSTRIDYMTFGMIGRDGRQLEALIFGLSACILMLFHLPRHAGVARLATFSFTIYLYHVLGTAGTRRILLYWGVDSLAIHLLAGLAAGLLVPVAIHLWAMRWPLAQQLILGIQPRAGSGGPSPALPHSPAGFPARAMQAFTLAVSQRRREGS